MDMDLVQDWESGAGWLTQEPRVRVWSASPVEALPRVDPRRPGPGRQTRKQVEWFDRAACRGYPTDWWFPEPHRPAFVSARARAICADCPVKSECGTYGAREKYGIWGGPNREVRRCHPKGDV